MTAKTPRVALIHDWLTGMRGGEKVLEVLCGLFPSADIFTLVHLPGRVSPILESHRIFTAPWLRFPGIGRVYRHLLPLLPTVIEQFDFRGYDMLISSSHCVAKGAIPPPGTEHWCYCHTPMRYVWDQYDQYFGPEQASMLVRSMMKQVRPYLQRWDTASASRVHHFLANSQNVRARIRRIYDRESQVVYPPADVEFFSQRLKPTPVRGDFYLIVSALAPYKRLDLALDACRQLNKKLVVIGEGQESALLRCRAGPQTSFLGWADRETMRDYFQRAQGLLFPGEEDFGIVPVEAIAAGCPVIAYQAGGALETVRAGETGLFFKEQTVESMMQAMTEAEKHPWDHARFAPFVQRFSRQDCEAMFHHVFSAAGILPPRA